MNEYTETRQLSTPTPTTARNSGSRQIDDLKSVVATQDTTIEKLQTQFASLRASYSAHTDSLQKEVASLRTYNQVLEEQQAQRTPHHGQSTLHYHPSNSNSPSLPSASPRAFMA